MELITEFAPRVGDAIKSPGSSGLKSHKLVDPGTISWSSLPKKQDLLELHLKFAFFPWSFKLKPLRTTKSWSSPSKKQDLLELHH